MPLWVQIGRVCIHDDYGWRQYGSRTGKLSSGAWSHNFFIYNWCACSRSESSECLGQFTRFARVILYIHIIQNQFNGYRAVHWKVQITRMKSKYTALYWKQKVYRSHNKIWHLSNSLRTTIIVWHWGLIYLKKFIMGRMLDSSLYWRMEECGSGSRVLVEM